MESEKEKTHADEVETSTGEPDMEYVEPENEEESPQKGEKDSKSHESRNILVFLIVLVLISGAAALIYFKVYLPMARPQPPVVTPTDNYLYKNFEFSKINGLWTTDVQVGNKVITIWLHHGPREVSDLSINGTLYTSFDKGPVYITFNPLDERKEMIALSAGELSLNIVNGVQRQVIAACTINETNACSKLPIVNCDDQDRPIIYLKQSNTTAITFNQNCITIEGDGEELVRATDRLILLWYGIMDKQAEAAS